MFNRKLYQLTERLQARDLLSGPKSSWARSSRGHAITTRACSTQRTQGSAGRTVVRFHRVRHF